MSLAMMALALLQQAAQLPAPGAILLDRNRIDRVEPAPRAAPAAAPRPPVTIAAAGSGAPIRGIRFVGARAPAPVAAAAHRFLGRPATRETLGALAAALSAAYGRSPIALYTVAIPQQSLAGGVVVVGLTEGRIAHARIVAKDGRRHPLLARRLARLTQEAPLGRAAFERQITLIRATPGLVVDTRITDPRHDGALDLDVTATQRRVRVTAGFSNRGVDRLGDGELDLRGEADAVALDGDQLVVAAASSTDVSSFRTVSASYAAPLAPSGLTAGANLAYLETRPYYRGLGHPVLGSATQAGVTMSYPLLRGFARSADASLGIDGLDSDAAAFGNVLSREHSRALRAAGSYTAASARRSVSVSASLSHGLAIAGARADARLADLAFTKIVANAAIAQSIGRRLVARLSASGQYSADLLPAAERFAIGGGAIGRAFDTALVTGDRGGGGSAELAWRPVRTGRFATSELYGFVDGGSVRVLARGVLPTRDYGLASVGTGVRARYRARAELGLEAAHALARPYPGVADDWRLLVSWRLSV